MALFDDMLNSDESIFRDTVALDYDFIPKLIPYREDKQKKIAECIKPLFQERNAKNLLIFGRPGIGKTVACKKVVQEIEDHTDEIIPVYVNCWQKNSTFKIMTEICEQLDFKFIQNKRSDELFKIVKNFFNKRSGVFIFDEIDKIEDHDFLYSILEEIYRKSIILITNDTNWIATLDKRIKSRLMPERIEFLPYTLEETKGILKQRMKYAFVENIFNKEGFEMIAQKTYELEDIRSGLYLLREAGEIAESESSKKIKFEHAKKAIEKLDEYSIKEKENLNDEEQKILEIISEHPNEKIGDLYEKYKERGGQSVYKTFQRRIKALEQGKFIECEKVTGAQGNTTIINKRDVSKKLTDF